VHEIARDAGRRAIAGVAAVGLAGCGSAAAHHPAPRPPAARHARPAVLATPAAQQAALARFAALGRPVYCGARHGHLVALTFDDGPGRYTRLALRRLRAEHARATFFLVGTSVERYPRLPAQERERGAIGEHTATHADLRGLPRAAMRREIAAGRDDAAGASRGPVRLFRPPFGAHTPAVDAEVRRQAMVQVLWDVDSGDSHTAPPLDFHGIAREVRRAIRPGSIVLLHENRGQTIRALRAILPALRRRGLRSVTVPELLAADPPTPGQLAAGPDGCDIRPAPGPESG
jgi:peptidoglycan/xylan/chitin deacetylase (PgdA/CDA1 family)